MLPAIPPGRCGGPALAAARAPPAGRSRSDLVPLDRLIQIGRNLAGRGGGPVAARLVMVTRFDVASMVPAARLPDLHVLGS